MGIKQTIVFILLVLMLSVVVQAQELPDRIVVNSQEWTEVYSVMLFASLSDIESDFLVSDRHSRIITSSINSNEYLWTVNSENPYVTGFDDFLADEGYRVDDFDYDDINLDLAALSGVTSFVIVDDSYGYNAIAVAPYAVVSNSFVLFADQDTIGDVSDFLSEIANPTVLIYGHVDRVVLDELTQYNPEIINQDGDRFANNVEIVKKYQAISSKKQAILTNGEFIEKEIMSGVEPVLFIGRSNVPEVISNYVKESEIEVGVLIGNELVNTATFIRRQVGISVFVKFARSARNPASSISQVEALDTYYLPTYALGLRIDSVSYNSATNQLEVTLQNTAEQAVYFRGTYTVSEASGTVQTTGDTDPIFLEGGQYKTLTYNINSIEVEGTSINAFVIFGESRNALEQVIDLEFCLGCAQNFGVIDVIDNCEMDVVEISFDKNRQLFNLQAVNIGDVGCFIDVELEDVIVATERTNYGLERIQFIEATESKNLRIKSELEEDDFEDNEFINVLGFYGQRENSLTNTLRKRMPLLFSSSVFGFVDLASSALTILILVIIALIVLAIVRKRKKQDNWFLGFFFVPTTLIIN